jgi:hypothetical protein
MSTLSQWFHKGRPNQLGLSEEQKAIWNKAVERWAKAFTEQCQIFQKQLADTLNAQQMETVVGWNSTGLKHREGRLRQLGEN